MEWDALESSGVSVTRDVQAEASRPLSGNAEGGTEASGRKLTQLASGFSLSLQLSDLCFLRTENTCLSYSQRYACGILGRLRGKGDIVILALWVENPSREKWNDFIEATRTIGSEAGLETRVPASESCVCASEPHGLAPLWPAGWWSWRGQSPWISRQCSVSPRHAVDQGLHQGGLGGSAVLQGCFLMLGL